jgi:hypothetical protein
MLQKGSFHGTHEGLCYHSKKDYSREFKKGDITSPKSTIPGNSRWDLFPYHTGLFQRIQEAIWSPSNRIILGNSRRDLFVLQKDYFWEKRREVLHLQKGLFPCSPRPRCKHVMRVKKSYLAGPRPLFQLIPVSWEPA